MSKYLLLTGGGVVLSILLAVTYSQLATGELLIPEHRSKINSIVVSPDLKIQPAGYSDLEPPASKKLLKYEEQSSSNMPSKANFPSEIDKCPPGLNIKDESALSAEPDPLFEGRLAEHSVFSVPTLKIKEASKCSLRFEVNESDDTFLLIAPNLEIVARKITIARNNAKLMVTVKNGELLVENSNMAAVCSKFEIKLPYCGPQNGTLYVSVSDSYGNFSCDGLRGDFERLSLKTTKMIADFTLNDTKAGLSVKLGEDAFIQCKSMALELENGHFRLNNEAKIDE